MLQFLLTNDDGIDAPGLAALEQAAKSAGHLTVVAPDQHLSGCGHQVNAHRPLVITEVSAGRHALDGTPADCSRVGLLHIAPEVDWVLSGINDGGNLGVDVYMSGTVAAIREATLLGKQGIAFSQYRKQKEGFDWNVTARWVEAVLQRLLQEPLPLGAFWNVNFPDCGGDDTLPEIVLCPLEWQPLPVRFDLEEGRYHYRGVYHDRPRHPGTDVDVCFSGKIAVTQILLNG